MRTRQQSLGRSKKLAPRDERLDCLRARACDCELGRFLESVELRQLKRNKGINGLGDMGAEEEKEEEEEEAEETS